MAKKEIIQPDANIGFVGHVDHGKTTLTQQLSGHWTDTHSEEVKLGITIRLGYANFDMYKKGDKLYSFKEVGSKFHRRLSLVDAPGHESLMATMLSGAMIMDGAIVMIAANEVFPQPQTKEHLKALEIVGLKNIVIAQNKIDLVTPEKALKQYEKIQAYLDTTIFKGAPVVPISAFHKINIDLLLEAVDTTIKPKEFNAKDDPMMLVARSFDINKPGSGPELLRGGIIGGAVLQGEFKIGDEIELGPAKVVGDKTRAISTTIKGLMTGKDPIDVVRPGGSVAIMTDLDPSLTQSDGLTGRVVSLKGKLPPTWTEFKLKITLLDRVVGTKEETEVKPLAMKEILMLNTNSAATVGQVEQVKKGEAFFRLKLPVCAAVGGRVTISRRVGNRFRLIGYGEIAE